MRNFLRGFFRSGEWLTKLVLLIVGLMTGVVTFAFATSIINLGIGHWIILWIILAKNKKATKIRKDLLKVVSDIDTVPYWGKEFGLSNTIRLLADDEFVPYISKRGRISRNVEVSRSGRWFYVAGRYYPIHLVKSFDRTRLTLTMINGAVLYNQDWLGYADVKDALDDLFEENRIFERKVPDGMASQISETAFKSIWKKPLRELAYADWDQVKYAWEKEYAECDAGYLGRRNFSQYMENLPQEDIAKESMFTRVLMDEEINTLRDAILDGTLENPQEFFDLRKYLNDVCACNGVELLKALGYPENAMGEKFLFDCLRNVEKPYFERAVETLSGFPREELIDMIERRVEAAYSTGDVLWGAGLIYLANSIDYEISLSREARQQLMQMP